MVKAVKSKTLRGDRADAEYARSFKSQWKTPRNVIERLHEEFRRRAKMQR
jgi:hypothetical protein